VVRVGRLGCGLTTPQDLERWVYTGLTHGNIGGSASISDFVAWTTDGFAGDPSPGHYTPVGIVTNPATVTNICS